MNKQIERNKQLVLGYARISFDDDLDNESTTIENQKDIISHYVKQVFPDHELRIFEDRDKSGYTFDQRPGYQEMRKLLVNGDSKILIIKDFSRFSRRNSKGLVELEDLRDMGVRIISINDAIDYPTQDDWMAIQFRFLINEMPVTDASKKVRAVIKRKQEEGQWICTVPYGYIIKNMKSGEIEVVPDEAEIIRLVFKKYVEGWGYKRIANHLTDLNIPTPRTKEKYRIEARGDTYRRKATSSAWSIISIQGILTNDFYIGTLRQHKYKRRKINGSDVKTQENEQFIFEKHHKAIIDDKTWLLTQQLLKQRTKSNYRGTKKYDNVYSGLLFCGTCGSRMFSISRSDLAPAYVCGAYQKRGKKACTSHHIRVDVLDTILKGYIKKVKENSSDMLEQLKQSVTKSSVEVEENRNTISLLERQLLEAKEELKSLQKIKVRAIAKVEIQHASSPDLEDMIRIQEEAFSSNEDDLILKIKGLENQINLANNKRNDIIQITRSAKTVLDIFDDILKKPTLDRIDIQLIVDSITVFEDHVDIKLRADVDTLLKTGELSANFNDDSEVILSNATLYQLATDKALADYTAKFRLKIKKQPERLFTVNVVNSGDPLEIFTDREGEIILKKYSPIGELGAFAREFAESLAQTIGHLVCVTDTDQVIAAAGPGKKEFQEKQLTKQMGEVIMRREPFLANASEKRFTRITAEQDDEFDSQVVSPIICEGDAIGSVVILAREGKKRIGDTEQKLATCAAGFLGRQMEQ